MKGKLLWMLAVLMIAVFFCVSCAESFDDTLLSGKIDNLEKRVSDLEDMCARMNTNITSLQQLLNASQNNVYITSVNPFNIGGESGYIISFSNSSSVTIYNGKDGSDGKDGVSGQDGKDGKDGSDGVSPVIGVRKDSDGIYYWTINGEWLLDESGSKIKAVGSDGRDGKDGSDGKDGALGQDGSDGKDGRDGVTPEFKIEDGFWWISYDDGESWTNLGNAKGADGQNGDSFFREIAQDEINVYLAMADGTMFVIPKKTPFSIEMETEDIRFSLGRSYYIGYVLTGADESASITVFTSDGLKAEVRKTDSNTGSIVVTTPVYIVERSTVAVILSDGYGRTYTKAINFIYEGVNDIDNGVLIITSAEPLDFHAEGGTLSVPVQTNLNYCVEVGKNSSSWLSYNPAATKGAPLRNEEIILSAQANTGMARHGFVYLLDVSDRSILQTICVTQSASSDFLSEEVVFDDAKFKSEVLAGYDMDNDGKLTREEALEIRSLSLSSKTISSLSGIEYFSNLEILDCSSNKLTSLELSKNTALKILNCKSNPSLAKLDVSHNAMLENLDCSSTGITGLNVSANTILEKLVCGSNNKLTSLSVGSLSALKSIDCSSTSVTLLDVSGCRSLNELNCSGTKIASLDLSSNYGLYSLNAGSNSLERLRLGSIPSLKSISLESTSGSMKISGDYLNSVAIGGSASTNAGKCDLSGCPNLRSFSATSASHIFYKEYDFSGLKKLTDVHINNVTCRETTVNMENTGSLEKFVFSSDSRTLELTGISENRNLKVLKISAGLAVEPNISGLDNLEELELGQHNNGFSFMPAVITNKSLKKVSLTSISNETLDLSACVSLESLSLTTSTALGSIKLPDVSSLKSLYLLDLDNLNALDLSKQTELNTLSCQNCYLPDFLNLSNHLKLKSLSLSGVSGIEKIDLGDNPYIRELYNVSAKSKSTISVAGKNITYISCQKFFPDVSDCPALQSLSISDAAGLSLDLSGNPDMRSLTCSGIGLRELNVSGCRQLESLTCSKNELNTLDVSLNLRLTSLNCASMPTLQTLYLSKEQSIRYITYDRSTSYIPATTQIEYR